MEKKKKIKRIGMVLKKQFPPDIRVEKEARSLVEAGFKVFLLSKKIGNELATEKINGIVLNRINFCKKRLFRVIYDLRYYFNLTIYNPFWIKEIKEFVDRNNIDALHVHDLHVLGTALKAVKKKKIPIIVDLHENYPESLRFYTYKQKFWFLRRFIYNEKIWKLIEKSWLRKVNKIIVVVEEGKERIIKYGIPSEKIIVVSNLENIESFNKIEKSDEVIKRYKNNFIVSYVGGFGPHRGIDCLIKALPYLIDNIPNLKLLLVGGKNSAYEDELRQIVENLNVSCHVEFTGWQKFEKIPTFIEISDICLVPYNRSIQTDASSPHKLFQYMAKGKPVLVSNCKSLARIINETGGGLIFNAGDSKDLSEKILKIYKDENLRKKLGENGKKAALEIYNWKNESEKLIKIYNNIKR